VPKNNLKQPSYFTWILASLALLITIAIAFLLANLKTILTDQINQQLQAKQLDKHIQYTIDHIGLTSSQISDIRVGQQLEIDKITASYSPMTLLQKSIGDIVVHHVRLTLPFKEEGVDISDLKKIVNAFASKENTAPPLLPFNSLTIHKMIYQPRFGPQEKALFPDITMQGKIIRNGNQLDFSQLLNDTGDIIHLTASGNFNPTTMTGEGRLN